MKKTIGWIAAAAVFVVFLVGAVVLYNRLSADYQPEQLATDQPSPSQTENAGRKRNVMHDDEINRGIGLSVIKKGAWLTNRTTAPNPSFRIKANHSVEPFAFSAHS